MRGWKSVGRCVVCGGTVTNLAEGLEYLFPRRVLVHAGPCGTQFDVRLDVAVQEILSELEDGREVRNA